MKEESNVKLLINTLINFIVFPWLLLGGIPIALGIRAGKPWYGVIAGVVFVCVLYGYFAIGAIVGMAYALENPPKIGETQIKITFANKTIWESGLINFNPKRIGKILVRARHKHIWQQIREDHEKGMTPKEIKNKWKIKYHEDTISQIIKEGETHELD